MKAKSAGVPFLAVFLLPLVALLATAQQNPNHPVVLTNPQVNDAIKFDVSPPLRDIATEAPSQVALHEAHLSSTRSCSS